MGRKWLRDGGPKRCVRAFLRDQRGGTFVFMAIGLLASMSLAALAVDMGYLYILKNRLQTTADVAALAAVRQLPDQNALRTTALDYAPKNMAASAHGNVLVTGDVVPGYWNSSARTFTAATCVSPGRARVSSLRPAPIKIRPGSRNGGRELRTSR